MRRLTLHIGAHKTATNTLRRTLEHNEYLLRAKGLGLACLGNTPPVRQFLGFLDPDKIFPQGFTIQNPTAFAKVVAQPGEDHVFLSSENFSFIFQQTVLDEFALALSRHFDQIDILVYLRRQDRHAVSHHQEGAQADRLPEAVLWGHSLNALPEPSDLQRLYLDYDARLRLWENAFGSHALCVGLFDRAVMAQGDIVADALSRMGIDPSGLTRIEDQNVSLGRVQASVGHLANDTLADPAVTGSLIAALPYAGAKLLPCAQAARDFLAPYVASNRRLNERLQISTNPDLFSDDFSDYPQGSPEGLGADEWAAALRVAMTTLGPRYSATKDLTPDDLRKAAMALEHKDATAALRLARAAHVLRPEGPRIKQLKADLEARLNPPFTA